MKSIRITLVALIAVFALSAVAASSALASPEWYTKKSTESKEWEKLKEPIAVTGTSGWELHFEGLKGPWTFACSQTMTGTVTSGGVGTINEITNIKCSSKACTLRELKFLNFPMHTELYKEGTAIRQRILAGKSEEDTPGLEFRCEGEETALIRCTWDSSTSMSNTVFGKVEGVDAKYDTHSSKLKCGGFGEVPVTGDSWDIERSNLLPLKVE